MKPRVRLHIDFRLDFRRLPDDLVERGAEEWIAALREGVDQAMRLLTRFPAAGTRMDKRGKVELRRLIFPKGPYVAWYVVNGRDLWLIRLFHARQRRPRAKLRRRYR